MRITSVSLACCLASALLSPSAAQSRASADALRGKRASSSSSAGSEHDLKVPGSIPPGYCDGLWAITPKDMEAYEQNNAIKLETRMGGAMEDCAQQSKNKQQGSGAVLKETLTGNMRDWNRFELEVNGAKRSITCGHMPMHTARTQVCATVQANRILKVGPPITPPLIDAWRCEADRSAPDSDSDSDSAGQPIACFETENYEALPGEFWEARDSMTQLQLTDFAHMVVDNALDALNNGVAPGVGNADQLGSRVVNQDGAGKRIPALIDYSTPFPVLCRYTLPLFVRPMALSSSLVTMIQGIEQDNYDIGQSLKQLWADVLTGTYRQGDSRLPPISRITLGEETAINPENSEDETVVGVPGMMDGLSKSSEMRFLETGEAVSPGKMGGRAGWEHQVMDVLLKYGVNVYVVESAHLTIEFEGNLETAINAKLKDWGVTGYAHQWAKGKPAADALMATNIKENCPHVMEQLQDPQLFTMVRMYSPLNVVELTPKMEIVSKDEATNKLVMKYSVTRDGSSSNSGLKVTQTGGASGATEPKAVIM